MIKVESLKDYLKTNNTEEFIDIATKIYALIDFIGHDYPKHKEWYFLKQLPAIFGEERNILFVRDPENLNEIIAIACLKENKEERKICTIYVSDKFRKMGIGTAIVEEAMKWLGTTKPLITFVDYKLEMFQSMIHKYNWELTEVVSELYSDESQELCFNGTLIKNKESILKQPLYKRLVESLKCRKSN